MQSWSLAQTPCALAQHALAGVIANLGRPQFAGSALAQLSPVLGVGSWAVYSRFPSRLPVLHLSASHRIADVTGTCFATYRDDGLYRDDTSFDPVVNARPCRQPVMLRMSADQAPSAAHRDAIYVRHGIAERLSVARLEDDGALFAVNLYRHTHQGRFTEDQVAQLADIGAGLIAAVARHVEWISSLPAKSYRDLLRQRCAALTERELDVLERLLQGMTYDGIATHMGVSFASVKTYRARAFERLNIHFRNELFASFASPAVDLSDDSASTQGGARSDKHPKKETT